VTTALATDLLASAESVMRHNDTGSYSVPSRATYPHQWNWDSALIALGWAELDPPPSSACTAALCLRLRRSARIRT
jgi:hypothetical protein